MRNDNRIRRGDENRADRLRWERWLWAGLFLGLFVYVWMGIRPQWLHSGFGVFVAYPVFSWESAFLRSALSVPGGPLNALAALLAQTYRSPSLGALAIVAVSGVLFGGVLCLLRSMRAARLRDLAWVPAIVASMIYSRYDDPLPALLALGLSIWMAVLYQVVPMRTLPVQAGVFGVLFALAYWWAGAAAFVFAGVVCLIEALQHRKTLAAIVQVVLAGGAAIVLGRFIFGLEPRAIYSVGTLWDSSGRFEFAAFSHSLIVVLYAFVPALVLTVSLGRVLAGVQRRSCVPARQGERGRSPYLLWTVARVLAVIVTTAVCLMVSRNHLRDERALHHYAQQRDWEQVVALAHRMRGKRPFTRSGVFDTNRALAHLGRLGDELCAYPQDETRTLFLGFDAMFGRFQHAKLLELYLDLGCPNAAEKNAYELLDNEGPSPYVLEAMVRIHLAKGRHESARIAFEALRKYAGSGRYIRQWQDVITDPAKADSHPLVRAWRRAQATTDHAVAGIAFEPLLRRLLHDTPDHRLAFEYLMAHFLLKHQRAAIVSGLPLLAPLGYTRLPHHYAEAVLVHSLETKAPPDMRGWTIDPEVNDRFRQIRAAVQNARGDNQAVFDTLAARYGDTYTFYSLFNVCGVR
ncbi:DUF6057 family protein [Anaerobaca lacustris]|uniref:DUF6057 family protein n=1 Tax=Anaerobaca lacustris TaxID=3044600 RepID=A0AAW6U1Z3_9BACT|nr:DUF6057 family protein [Sedimentisphaerales bacterium M17dextr]